LLGIQAVCFSALLSYARLAERIISLRISQNLFLLLNKNEVKMVSEVPMTIFAGRKLCAIDFQLAYFHTAVHKRYHFPLLA